MAGRADIKVSFDLIEAIGESIGLELTDLALKVLTDDVNDRLQLVVQDAIKFMYHGKRQKLLIEDVEYSLKIKNFGPIFGNDADEDENSQQFRVVRRGDMELFVPAEETIDLEDLACIYMPKPPADAQIIVHWLALDGIQPSIPENPVRVLSLEDEEKEVKNKADARKREQGWKTEEMARLKSYVKHDVSMELQAYLEEVAGACVARKEVDRNAALQSLSTDSGLYQILPHLCAFIVNGVRRNLHQRNLAPLIYLMRTCKALLDNPSLSLEPHLHELVPAVMSCLVCKDLTKGPELNHWLLREFSAKLLSRISRMFHNSVNMLQPRITRLLTDSLATDAVGMNEKYGAVCGIMELGPDSVKNFLLPVVKNLGEEIRSVHQSMVNAEGSGEEFEQLRTATNGACEQLRNIILKACVPVLKAHRPLPDVLDEYRADFGCFGNLLHAQVTKARTLGTMGMLEILASVPGVVLDGVDGGTSATDDFTI